MKKVALFSKEYPPYVYGGAGVHVEYLAAALARHVDVEMRCFGDQHADEGRLTVRGYPQWEETKRDTDPRFVGAIDAYARSLAMAKDQLDADLVHCHTWYTDMGGLIAAKLWGVPYVLTIHSLEPLRPWKVEQLGNGYHLSAWMERTAIEQADAIIAVSKETRADRAAAVRREARARPCRAQRHRSRRVQGGRRHRRAHQARHRSEKTVPALRRPHHTPEGHHPSRQRDPEDRSRAANRAGGRRAGHVRRSVPRWRPPSRRSRPTAPA